MVCDIELFLRFLTHLTAFMTLGALNSVYQVWQATAEVLEMRRQWSDAFRDAELDVVLHPAMPIPAPHHGTASKNPTVSYMQIAPLLGWPSGVVPVTTIRKDEEHYGRSVDGIDRAAAKVMANSAGLPMSVSVLAPEFRDEVCLAAMKEIENLVEFDAKPLAYR